MAKENTNSISVLTAKGLVIILEEPRQCRLCGRMTCFLANYTGSTYCNHCASEDRRKLEAERAALDS